MIPTMALRSSQTVLPTFQPCFNSHRVLLGRSFDPILQFQVDETKDEIHHTPDELHHTHRHLPSCVSSGLSAEVAFEFHVIGECRFGIR